MVIRKMTVDDYDKVYNLQMSCVGMWLNNLDDSGEGIDTAIHPDYRKQGIAKKLVNTAMNELSALGINKIAPIVFARNETRNAFRKIRGFIVRSELVYRNKHPLRF